MVIKFTRLQLNNREDSISPLKKDNLYKKCWFHTAEVQGSRTVCRADEPIPVIRSVSRVCLTWVNIKLGGMLFWDGRG